MKRDDDWQPTPDNINALPDPVRRYIMELETNADPAGMVREAILGRDTLRALELRNQELDAEVARLHDRIAKAVLSAGNARQQLAELIQILVQP